MRRESGFFQLEIGIVSKITWLQPGLRIEMSWRKRRRRRRRRRRRNPAPFVAGLEKLWILFVQPWMLIPFPLFVE